MSAAKILVIAVLMILAAFFLAMGLDIPIPDLPWHGLPARDIPIGIVLLLAGLAVARFWTVPENEDRLVEEWKHRKIRK